MKRHSGFKSILVSLVSVSLISGAFFGMPGGAQAELAVPTTGSSSAPLATEEVYCDAVCPTIANSNGQLYNTSGTIGWTATDDQWCANHNSQTNPAVMASPAPLGATVPTQSCSVAYYPGDTSCAQVTAGYNLCQYHNSQVQTYCQAYESAKMAGAGEEVVLALDIAATATCGTVCAAEMTSLGAGALGSVAAQKVCDGAAMGAGAAELLVSFEQQSSTMGKIAEGVLGAAGIAEGAMGWIKASKQGHCDSNASSRDPLPFWERHSSFLECSDDVVAYLIPKAEAAYQTTQGCAKAACITAATMAALSGLRYYNMGYGQRTKAKSCNSIWALQSSASAIAGGITAAGYTASGGSTSASSGSSISSTGSSGTTTNPATGQSCTASNITSASCGQVSAATDGGILANSGLGNAVAPLAQQLAAAGLPAALQSGGLGSAMGGAMSGDGNMGAALTKVAEAAAANGKELGQVASMSSGGGGGGGTASDTNALAGLFANSGPSAVTAPMAVFKGDGEDSDDIWHSHSSNNIFQIVSHRIGKVNP